MSGPPNVELSDEPTTRAGERVVMWLFTCGGLYLLLAPLLIVLTVRQDAVGYWSAGALSVVWLAGSTVLTLWVTCPIESESPADQRGAQGSGLS